MQDTASALLSKWLQLEEAENEEEENPVEMQGTTSTRTPKANLTTTFAHRCTHKIVILSNNNLQCAVCMQIVLNGFLYVQYF